MVPVVLSASNAGQVAQVVIQWVVVYMVDVVTGRDWPVLSFPNLLMETTYTVRLVCYPRCEVHAIAAMLRFWVATEFDAIEDDCFGFHDQSISSSTDILGS